MSTLFLIRHGQASFGASDYDVLSDLGAAQGRALGQYFAGRVATAHALYVGPRRRHADTAASFLDGARARGVEYPAPTLLPGLDEYPAVALLRHHVPRLRAEDPAFRALLGSDGALPDAALPDGASMQRAFEYIIDRWVRGELGIDGGETFAGFRDRVRQALGRIMEEQGRSKTVLAFTSGGPIGMALHWALGLTDEVALRQAWVIGNGSFSEFRYRDPSALTLVEFNSRCHLEPDAISYR